jgi:phosphatidylinositol-3-phosphatase
MKTLLTSIFILILFLGLFYKPETSKKINLVHKYDHVVIVIEENKNYDQVIGNEAAPYINSIKKEGANLTQMYAEEHASEGNYFWFFSGNNQNVGFDDVIPDSKNNKNYPFKSDNLAEELIKHGYSFKGFSEDLPKIGDAINYSGYYARKHVPWISFGNIPNGFSVGNSINLQFKQFPADFSKLPTVSFVIPNLIDDMHDPKSPDISVKNGDGWLKKNLDSYYQWAKTHNSLLIITFDENDDKSQYRGLTNPASENRDIRNRIPTIIAGADILPGNYAEGKGVTHINILRTIESMYGLPKSGQQPQYASKFGIKDDYIITDIFK